MDKTKIFTEKSYISWVKFVMVWLLFLGFNFLILYFYPRNIYSDISFVLFVVFTFKFLRFSSINIFLCGTSYLWLAFIVILLRNYFIPSRLIDGITFYIPCFFILSSLGFIYEQKLESKITLRKNKIAYLCLFCVFSVLFIFLFVSFNLKQNSTKIIIGNTKQLINRIFKKQEYYSKKDFVIIDGEKVKEEITIFKYFSKEGIPFSGKIKINGWAIEKNAKYDSGIDRIEFFLDGKPGEGKYLGKFTQNYKAELETKNYIENLYFNFYNRLPSNYELEFWAINLEHNIMSYYEVADNIIRKSGLMESGIPREDFFPLLYAGLLNSDWNGDWSARFDTDPTYEELLYIVINSEAFKVHSKSYYENISIKDNDLDIIRKGIGEKYGKQFYLSGFSFKFDSTTVSDGEHTLYIYANSPLFGWDYQTVNLIIDNND